MERLLYARLLLNERSFRLRHQTFRHYHTIRCITTRSDILVRAPTMYIFRIQNKLHPQNPCNSPVALLAAHSADSEVLYETNAPECPEVWYAPLPSGHPTDNMTTQAVTLRTQLISHRFQKLNAIPHNKSADHTCRQINKDIGLLLRQLITSALYNARQNFRRMRSSCSEPRGIEHNR